jgi:hypothetical protein
VSLTDAHMNAGPFADAIHTWYWTAEPFRSPDFNTIKAKLKSPVMFDGRNLYDPVLVRGMGFEYLAIAFGAVSQFKCAKALGGWFHALPQPAFALGQIGVMLR